MFNLNTNKHLQQLSPAHIQHLESILQSSRSIELSTTPAQPFEVEIAVRNAYRAAGMSPPMVLWCSSPLEAFLSRAIIVTLSKKWSPNEYTAGNVYFDDSIIGSNVRYSLRDKPIDIIEEKIHRVVSDPLWNQLTRMAGAPTWQPRYFHPPVVSAIVGAINKIAYRENASAVRHDFGRHEWIPDSIWSAACESAEQFMGRKIPWNLKSFQALSSHKWPYFFNSMRGSLEDSSFGQHEVRHLVMLQFLNSLLHFGGAFGAKADSLRALFSLAQSTNMYLAHEKVCWVVDRQCRFQTDDQGRIHSSDGTAIEYRDGWSLYFWHGVRVNKKIIEHPESITLDDIDSESNAEVRSAMLERYGMERYFVAGDLETVDCHPYFGTLLRRRCRNAPDIMMVRVENSTVESDGRRKIYLLRVPEDMRTARQAVAWTFGLEAYEYNPLVET